MKHLVLLIILILPMAVFAVEPDEILQDPVLEQRAREISRNCAVLSAKTRTSTAQMLALRVICAFWSENDWSLGTATKT